MTLWNPAKSTEPAASPIVVIDISYIAHRARHATGYLSYQGLPTGTLYGTLVQMKRVMPLFPKSTRWVFAWDSKSSLRCDMYPLYKTRRRSSTELTIAEEQERLEFFTQMEILRPEVLEPMGFRDHLFAEGYEADDLIACVCDWAKRFPQVSGGKKIYIVSSDHDLFQLLHLATMYRLHESRNFTEDRLLEEFFIAPQLWAEVLAIAGCDGDGVPGVHGVGVKTAVKYLNGKKISGRQVTAIQRAKRMIDRNRKLVALPFNDNYFLVPDDFNPIPFRPDPDGVREVSRRFGFASLEREWLKQ